MSRQNAHDASLLKNPDRGKIPERAKAPTVMHTMGMVSLRPPPRPISRMSLVWNSWMKMPEHKKRRALNPAWVVR